MTRSIGAVAAQRPGDLSFNPDLCRTWFRVLSGYERQDELIRLPGFQDLT
jgi:hypothetical protein